MDTKQLMIGDFVEYRNVNELTQICKVCSVSNLDGDIIYCEFDDGIYDAHQSTIHPIQITEEILKENNIEWEFYDCYHFEFKNRGVVVTLSGYPYVHELQHVLRLVGLDDMADNFKI